MSDLAARRATAADADRVTEIITLAFAQDPLWGRALARPDGGDGHHAAFWRVFVEGALRYPWTWLTGGGEATSIWIPPGGTDMTPEQEQQLAGLATDHLGPAAGRGRRRSADDGEVGPDEAGLLLIDLALPPVAVAVLEARERVGGRDRVGLARRVAVERDVHERVVGEPQDQVADVAGARPVELGEHRLHPALVVLGRLGRPAGIAGHQPELHWSGRWWCRGAVAVSGAHWSPSIAGSGPLNVPGAGKIKLYTRYDERDQPGSTSPPLSRSGSEGC